MFSFRVLHDACSTRTLDGSSARSGRTRTGMMWSTLGRHRDRGGASLSSGPPHAAQCDAAATSRARSRFHSADHRGSPAFDGIVDVQSVVADIPQLVPPPLEHDTHRPALGRLHQVPDIRLDLVRVLVAEQLPDVAAGNLP